MDCPLEQSATADSTAQSEIEMKFVVVLCSAALLAACSSAPKPTQPEGPWMPVNHATQGSAQ
jgi:uncharacterized lipoprotein YajG